ncbi:MAG: hypothetical protein FWG09_01875, partial [Synergistaceae bacterium]|nr:hypothetical protein [Synergistaceae bacterium]
RRCWMMGYDTFEDELHVIRLKIYEEIKDMTPQEEIDYLKAQIAPVHKQFGIRTVNEIKAYEQMKKEAV